MAVAATAVPAPARRPSVMRVSVLWTAPPTVTVSIVVPMVVAVPVVPVLET